MKETAKHQAVESRNEPFVEKVATRIWQEESSMDNPFIAAAARCYGYDIIELSQTCSFVDVFYLLFRGELPSKDQADLLETLMKLLINLGPRHMATRAAMNAGVGKTDPVHILPVALAVLGGEYRGAGMIESAMRFFRKNQHIDPKVFMPTLLVNDEFAKNILIGFPGFGQFCGGIDLLTKKFADQLSVMSGAGDALKWGQELSLLLVSFGVGWQINGLAAATLADLGFQPRAGACLYQLLCAPGLAAHGLEMTNKPITAMPFVKDENYAIER